MAVPGDLGNPYTLWTIAQVVDTAVPGNQPTRNLRRRRYPQRVGQASRDRDRGRLDGGAARLRTTPGHRQCPYGPSPRRPGQPQCGSSHS